MCYISLSCVSVWINYVVLVMKLVVVIKSHANTFVVLYFKYFLWITDCY